MSTYSYFGGLTNPSFVPGDGIVIPLSYYGSHYYGPFNIFYYPDQAPITLYGYTPNYGFNIFAAVVWGLVFAGHIWWLATKKTRAIQSMIAFGSALELIGYALRAHSHNNPYRFYPFIVQYVFIMTAPAFFIMALINAIGWGMRGNDQASVYVRYRPRAFTGALQALNAIATVIIVVTSAMFAVFLTRASRIQSTMYNGEYARRALIAGYAVQLLTLLALLGTLTHLLIHFKRDSLTPVAAPGVGAANLGLHPAVSNQTAVTAIDHQPTAPHTGRALSRMFLIVAFFTAGMLLTRSAYRLAETVQNVFGMTWNSQPLFAIFEFAVVWVAVAIWAARPFATQLAHADVVHAAPGTTKHRV